MSLPESPLFFFSQIRLCSTHRGKMRGYGEIGVELHCDEKNGRLGFLLAVRLLPPLHLHQQIRFSIFFVSRLVLGMCMIDARGVLALRPYTSYLVHSLQTSQNTSAATADRQYQCRYLLVSHCRERVLRFSFRVRFPIPQALCAPSLGSKAIVDMQSNCRYALSAESNRAKVQFSPKRKT